MSRAMTGAEMVLQALADQGVEHIFGYPGGAVLPIYDELYQQDRIKHILVRHEQGAVHAAEGYARSTGKVGVRARHLGPRRDQRRHRPDRCADGFDPDGLHHRPGADASDRQRRLPGMRHGRHHAPLHQAQLSRQGRERICRRVLHEAFYVARTGRPGPVVVDIPKDIQFAKGDYTGLTNSQHKSYNPQHPTATTRAVAHGRRADGQRQAAALLYRRRHHQFRAARPASACASWCA